jgi:hypothetical protein
MKRNVLLLILMGVFLLSFLSAGGAGENIGTYKKDTCIRLPQTCATCTYSIISTILSPNGTSYLSEESMVQTGTYFEYSFCNTSELGDYKVNGHFDVLGVDEVFNYVFSVTNTGVAPTSAQGSLSIGVIVGILIIMVFFGFLAFKFMENDETFVYGLFFLVFSLLLAIYSLYLGFTISNDFLFANVSTVQGKVFIGALFGLTGIMFIAFTFFIMYTIKQLKIRKDNKQYGEGFNHETRTYNY